MLFFFTDKYPPRIQGTPKRQYNAKVGEVKRLRCGVTGQPPPAITWSKDGKPLQLSERVRNLSSNRTIKIKQVRLGDQGNYTCIAENALGKLNLTLNLHVRQGTYDNENRINLNEKETPETVNSKQATILRLSNWCERLKPRILQLANKPVVALVPVVA